MITAEQVKELQPGDVVRVTGWDGLTVEGPVGLSGADGGLWLGNHIRLNFAFSPSRPAWMGRPAATLTVVSRAPRSLYVNHPRTEPVPGDVVRDEEADGTRIILRTAGDQIPDGWIDQDGVERDFGLCPGRRLRLLVDGETGQQVSS